MPCQPLCGVSLCVDGSTCGRCAGTVRLRRQGRVASQTRRRAREPRITGIHAHGWNECSYVSRWGFRPTFRTPSHSLIHENSASPRPPGAATGSAQPHERPRGACIRHSVSGSDTHAANGRRTAHATATGAQGDPTVTPIPLPAVEPAGRRRDTGRVTAHTRGGLRCRWDTSSQFQAEALRSRIPCLSDTPAGPGPQRPHPDTAHTALVASSLAPDASPPPQDDRHRLTTCWQHLPSSSRVLTTALSSARTRAACERMCRASKRVQLRRRLAAPRGASWAPPREDPRLAGRPRLKRLVASAQCAGSSAWQARWRRAPGARPNGVDSAVVSTCMQGRSSVAINVPGARPSSPRYGCRADRWTRASGLLRCLRGARQHRPPRSR